MIKKIQNLVQNKLDVRQFYTAAISTFADNSNIIISKIYNCYFMTIICRCPSELFWSLHLVYGMICQILLHICSVTTFFPAPSQDLSFSAILSGHHCDT